MAKKKAGTLESYFTKKRKLQEIQSSRIHLAAKDLINKKKQ